jgi:hypothetical protein
MTTREDIVKYILSQATTEELVNFGEAAQMRRTQLAKRATYVLRPGAKVEFTNSRSGMIVNGVVEKVNIKNVIVRDNATHVKWRVPGHMLRTVS